MALKKTFSKDKKKCSVTFTVSKEAAQGAKTKTPLKQAKDGSFSVKLNLEAGKEYQFRYLLDGQKWENDWNADKYVPAPYSNAENSVVITIQ